MRPWPSLGRRNTGKMQYIWGVLPGGSSMLYYGIRYGTKFYHWYLFSVLLEENNLNSTLVYSQM